MHGIVCMVISVIVFSTEMTSVVSLFNVTHIAVGSGYQMWIHTEISKLFHGPPKILFLCLYINEVTVDPITCVTFNLQNCPHYSTNYSTNILVHAFNPMGVVTTPDILVMKVQISLWFLIFSIRLISL